MLKVFLLGMFCSVLYVAFLAFFSADSMTITYENSKLQLGRTPLILFKDMLNAQWMFIVFGGLVITFLSLLMSHHFAGPLYKLEMSVKSMIEGDHSLTIYLRRHDKGSELAETINKFNEKLSGDIREMRSTALTLSKKLSDLDSSRTETLPGAIDEAASLAKRLEEMLQRYKIKA